MSSSVSPLREIRLVAERQLVRTLFGVKGIAIVLLSVLSVVAVASLAASIEQLPRTFVESGGSAQFSFSTTTDDDAHSAPLTKPRPPLPDAASARKAALFFWFHDEAIAEMLARAPDVLILTFVLGGFFTPGIVMILGYDLLGGEGQVRTLRYFVTRCRRWTLFAGKLVALALSVAAITAVLQLSIIAVIVARGQAPLGTAFAWGVRLWAIALPAVVGWCSLTGFVAACFPEPMQSLLAANGVFFGLWIAHFQPSWRFIYPDTYTDLALAPDARTAVTGVVGALLLSIAATAGGAVVFSRAEV